MKRLVKTTADNSKTLYIESLNESYHSQHGALQEAKHVFIKNGLNRIDFSEINILEMGFGTGLNVLVSIDEILKKNQGVSIQYFTLEKYPIQQEEIAELNYFEAFENPKLEEIYYKIHDCRWNEMVEIVPNFKLKKIQTDFFSLPKIELPPIDLVYYDCFGARVQPDLWEKPLFEMVKNKMKRGALLTTYSSKGSVRRNLQELGFTVEKLEGPKGKREMINAWMGEKL